MLEGFGSEIHHLHQTSGRAERDHLRKARERSMHRLPRTGFPMKSLAYWIAAAGAAISGVAAALAADPLSLSPAALREIAKVEAEIDRIEAAMLGRLAAPAD